MRRLENSDEEKFWEAWIKDDTVFCYRFGKIGTQGQTRIKRHASRAEADADLEENLARKLKEGFEEKSEGEEEEKDAAEEEEADEAEDDDDDEEDDDDEDEDEAPKKKRAAPKHVAVVPPAEPSKPALPSRARAAPHKLAPEQITAARNAIEALHGAVGKRSWKVRKLARRARQSLERVAGIDPSKHGFGDAFDALMGDVVGAKKRLPLELATGLLLELDANVFVRTVKHWKSASSAGPAAEAIAALATSVDAIQDADVALHVGAAFAERRLDASSWRKRFRHVKPALEAALKKHGSTLPKFLKSIDASDDTLLASRVEEAAR